jgi:hypothetical protein
MKTFYKILQDELGMYIPSFPCEHYWFALPKSSMSSPEKILLYQYIIQLDKEILLLPDKKDKNILARAKFSHLDKILSNIFLSQEQRDEILRIFSKCQRIYYAFSRVAYLYKYKKSKIVIDTDLDMNVLNEKERNVFCLFQSGNKTMFRIYDLIKIINRGLSNSPNFFPNPLAIKNPYNNIDFTHTELYNIYFFMINRGFIISPLFQQYYKANFDEELFTCDSECLIREVSIRNYIYTSHVNTLYPAVKAMFYSYRGIMKHIRIHPAFPKDRLVTIMRPYLELYYLNAYYIQGTMKYSQADRILKEKLRAFTKFNPNFGRKKITIQQNKIIQKVPFVKTVLFDDNHISFYSKSLMADPNAFQVMMDIFDQYEFDPLEDNDSDIDSNHGTNYDPGPDSDSGEDPRSDTDSDIEEDE